GPLQEDLRTWFERPEDGQGPRGNRASGKTPNRRATYYCALQHGEPRGRNQETGHGLLHGLKSSSLLLGMTPERRRIRETRPRPRRSSVGLGHLWARRALRNVGPSSWKLNRLRRRCGLRKRGTVQASCRLEKNWRSQP